MDICILCYIKAWIAKLYFFYMEPRNKEPTCRMPKYSENLHYYRQNPYGTFQLCNAITVNSPFTMNILRLHLATEDRFKRYNEKGPPTVMMQRPRAENKLPLLTFLLTRHSLILSLTRVHATREAGWAMAPPPFVEQKKFVAQKTKVFENASREALTWVLDNQNTSSPSGATMETPRPFFNIQTTGEISPSRPNTFPSSDKQSQKNSPVVWAHWITFQIVKIS